MKKERFLNILKTKKTIIFLVIVSIIYILINVLYFKGPLVLVNGSNTITIEVGSPNYNDKGYHIFPFNDHLKDKVLTTSNIDLNKLGTYKVKYTLYYRNKEITSTRKVVVKDTTKPELTLNEKEKSYACPGKEYEEQGYKAIDNYDGDISENVIVDKKENEWLYTITDTSGNITKDKREIVHKDETKPVLSLKGANATIYRGRTYSDPGVSATDNCDGDISGTVKVEGSVDSNKAGTYTLKYIATDSSGNTSEIERKVTVVTQSVYLSNTIYLTFDDGPSYLTSQYIDVLNRYKVKGTFFINDKGYHDQIRRMANDGHTVANHTASHNFNYVYSSSDAFWSDIHKIDVLIKNLTGINNRLFRFPGGSSNTISRFNRGIMSRLVSESNAKGYIYFDWNVDSNDAGGSYTSDAIYRNVVNSLSHSGANVVLMHDGKQYTLDALSRIIEFGLNNGYNFAALDETSFTAHHGVAN